MLIKLTGIHEEVVDFNSGHKHIQYVVSEIYVNPQHIVLLKEDLRYIELHIQKKLPEGFAKNQKFTTVYLNKSSGRNKITVIGDIAGIAYKINEGKQNG